jgi:enoyl-[acyl-carrier-protein] reductase (NADH)
VLAVELGSRGITANSLLVGPVASGFLGPSAPGVIAAPPGMMDYIAAASPMGRMGESADIAAVVAFLAGPAAGWVNGQQILVNNGGPLWSARRSVRCGALYARIAVLARASSHDSASSYDQLLSSTRVK